jgi:hypothetical protein
VFAIHGSGHGEVVVAGVIVIVVVVVLNEVGKRVYLEGLELGVAVLVAVVDGVTDRHFLVDQPLPAVVDESLGGVDIIKIFVLCHAVFTKLFICNLRGEGGRS